MKQSGPTVDTLHIILGRVTRKVRITEKILWKATTNLVSQCFFLW